MADLLKFPTLLYCQRAYRLTVQILIRVLIYIQVLPFFMQFANSKPNNQYIFCLRTQRESVQHFRTFTEIFISRFKLVRDFIFRNLCPRYLLICNNTVSKR